MAAVRDAVTAALAGGKKNLEAILTMSGLKASQAGPALAALVKSRSVLRTGTRGSYEYELSAGSASFQNTGSKKKRKNKAANLRAARRKGARRNPAAPAAPNGHDGDGFDFAMTAGAALSIKQGETAALILDPPAFARLRDFINRTCPIWDPDDQA